MANSYRVRMHCTNCLWSGEQEYPYGQAVPVQGKCPKCGVYALLKGWPVRPRVIMSSDVPFHDLPTPPRRVEPMPPLRRYDPSRWRAEGGAMTR